MFDEFDFESLGQLGYQLEPEYTEDQLFAFEEAEHARLEGIANDPGQHNTNWCSSMPLPTEWLCWHEFELSLMVTYILYINECITALAVCATKTIFSH